VGGGRREGQSRRRVPFVQLHVLGLEQWLPIVGFPSGAMVQSQMAEPRSHREGRVAWCRVAVEGWGGGRGGDGARCLIAPGTRGPKGPSHAGAGGDTRGQVHGLAPVRGGARGLEAIELGNLQGDTGRSRAT